MNEFFTWGMLATYAGATLATSLVTQMFKGVAVFDRLPTRLFSYLVALVILAGATLTAGPVTVSSIGLCFVNAVVVALAANGGYDALTNGKKAD